MRYIVEASECANDDSHNHVACAYYSHKTWFMVAVLVTIGVIVAAGILWTVVSCSRASRAVKQQSEMQAIAPLVQAVA